MRALAAVLLLCGCATLNTAGMSEHCKTLYNACLNGCPDAARPGNPNPPPTAVQTDINPQIASCTDACNRQARLCKD
jgi:hypothetical protein